MLLAEGEQQFNVLRVAAAIIVALAAGTVLRLIALRHGAEDIAKKQLNSLLTWWVLAVVVIGSALLGRMASAVLFAVCSLASIREFVRLSPGCGGDRRLLYAAYCLIPLNYLCICLGWSHVFFLFLPMAMPMVSSILLVMMGTAQGFVSQVGRVCFGVLLTSYFLSHSVLLFNLPAGSNLVAGGSGWFLFLIILTEANDISQALVGRRLGKRRIAPHVSPNKTWEGFLGGVLTTVLLAIALAAWLTPFTYLESIVSGGVIAVAGFFGDLTMSAVKRDAGVSDSSRLLPGQGGILDRVDSLTFSAPTFYYLVLVMG